MHVLHCMPRKIRREQSVYMTMTNASSKTGHQHLTMTLTVTNAFESRIICLMLEPPAPMMAPTAEFGTLI